MSPRLTDNQKLQSWRHSKGTLESQIQLVEQKLNILYFYFHLNKPRKIVEFSIFS